MKLEWNQYQKDIFQEIAVGDRHLIIEAKAGSGKTQTAIECLSHFPEKKSWLLTAFNKKNAEELKSRVPDGSSGTISTIHALGLKSIASSFPNINIDQDKLYRIVDKVIKLSGLPPEVESREYREILVKSVTFAKSTLSKTSQEIEDILDDYDIDTLDFDREKFIVNTQSCLDLSKDFSSIDFSDMVWGPNIFKMKFKKYDNIIIDEYQDLTRAQIEFLLLLCKKKGRVILFGDKSQNIYQFTSADVKLVYKSLEALSPKVMPLSVSYRCPISVIAEAQRYVPDIQAAPGAKQGEVHTITEADLYKIAKPGCFIISRTNAPMLGIALKFIQMGIPANIRGRDIGNNLMGFIQNSKAKSIEALKNYIDKWRDKEVARLVKRQRSISAITDKYECLQVLTEGCKEVEQVKARMHKLFSDENDASKILLTSTHRVKGDQNQTVFVLWSTYFGDDEEANNLRYVAVTRSQDKLYYVKTTPKKEKKEDESGKTS